MNQKEIKILNELLDDMNRILEEKEPKYEGLWKTAPISFLKLKLALQSRNLSHCLYSKKYKARALRKLIHIANYTFFLYYRLKIGEENTKK